jgi:hypothetical protein
MNNLFNNNPKVSLHAHTIPRKPFIAFSPGIGLSFGHGFALYTGFDNVSFTGPIALAGEKSALLPVATATAPKTKDLRDDDVDDDDIVMDVRRANNEG